MHKHECTSAGKVTQPSPGIPHGPDRSPALTTLQLRGQRVTCAALSHILDSAQNGNLFPADFLFSFSDDDFPTE
jgi:hypothetical protein